MGLLLRDGSAEAAVSQAPSAESGELDNVGPAAMVPLPLPLITPALPVAPPAAVLKGVKAVVAGGVLADVGIAVLCAATTVAAGAGETVVVSLAMLLAGRKGRTRLPLLSKACTKARFKTVAVMLSVMEMLAVVPPFIRPKLQVSLLAKAEHEPRSVLNETRVALVPVNA